VSIDHGEVRVRWFCEGSLMGICIAEYPIDWPPRPGYTPDEADRVGLMLSL